MAKGRKTGGRDFHPGDPRAGRPPGAKDKIPRSLKASIRRLYEEILSMPADREAIKAALAPPERARALDLVLRKSARNDNATAAPSLALFHHTMLRRRLPPLAWPTLFEILRAADYATGIALVTTRSLAARLCVGRETVCRSALRPLIAAGLVERVPLARKPGEFQRYGFRVCALRDLSSPPLPSLSPLSREEGRCLASGTRARQSPQKIVVPARPLVPPAGQGDFEAEPARAGA